MINSCFNLKIKCYKNFPLDLSHAMLEIFLYFYCNYFVSAQ